VHKKPGVLTEVASPIPSQFYPSPSLRSRQGRKHSSLSDHLIPEFNDACKSYWEVAVRYIEGKTSTDVARVVLGFLMDQNGVRLFFDTVSSLYPSTEDNN
jgi:hypothetical protein